MHLRWHDEVRVWLADYYFQMGRVYMPNILSTLERHVVRMEDTNLQMVRPSMRGTPEGELESCFMRVIWMKQS